MLADPRAAVARDELRVPVARRARRATTSMPDPRALPDVRPGSAAPRSRRRCELFVDERAARGPQRARAADGRPHVRERAARAALRHRRTCAATQFRRVDARRPEPLRAARQGRRADGDVVSRTARRRCCAARGSSSTITGTPPARRPPPGVRDELTAAASAPRTVRERLEHHRDESDLQPAATASWIRSASRSRTSTRSASWRDEDRETGDADRLDGPAGGRHGRATARRSCASALLAKPDQFVQTADREAHDLSRSAAASSTTTCRPCARSCARPRATTTGFRRS